MTCWKINDNDDIWNKVSNSITKELDCEPIYNKKFLKTKGLAVMRLQIFILENYLKQALIIFIDW